jgi:hypothetical protein
MGLSFNRIAYADESPASQLQRQRLHDKLVGPKRTQEIDISSVRGRDAASRLSQPINFSNSGYGIEPGMALSSRDRALFISNNRDLLSVIDQSSEAQDFLKKTNVSTRQDLIGIIVKTAHSLLKGDAATKLDENILRDKPLVASLLVLNTGGFRDLLNNDSDAVNQLVDGPTAQDSFDSLAKQVQNLFSDSSALNDSNFLKNNPRISAFLLTQPDTVRFLTTTNDAQANAQSFKDRANSDAFKAVFDNFIQSFAAATVKSGTYDSTFFSGNLNVADFVSSGQFLTGIPSPSIFLNDHPEYGLSNKVTQDKFNFSALVNDVTAFQAANLLGGGHPLSYNTLKTYSGLARLVVNNEDLRNSFRSTESKNDFALLLSQKDNNDYSSNTLDIVKNNFKSRFEDSHTLFSLVV